MSSNVSPFSGSPSTTPNEFSTIPIVTTLPSYNTVKPRTGPTTKPKRKRVNTAEKRSQHNAVERARRETLNGKFLHLARLLPSLASARRPSKAAIVNGSIKHLESTRSQRLLAVNVIRQIIAERDELLAENNQWRTNANMATRSVTNVNKDVAEIATVETEQFGTFANMDGDDNDDEDSQEADTSFEAAFPGLVTPRSSAEDFASQLFAPQLVTQSAPAAVPNSAIWSQDFAYAASAPVFKTDTRSSSGSPARVLTPGSTDIFGETKTEVDQQQQINTAIALWQHMQAQTQITPAQQTTQSWMQNYANHLAQLSPNSMDQWRKLASQPQITPQGLDLHLGSATYWPHHDLVEGF